jgi:hypothetical protein
MYGIKAQGPILSEAGVIWNRTTMDSNRVDVDIALCQDARSVDIIAEATDGKHEGCLL